MLFNEKYAIAYINFSTGRIIVDSADDEFSYSLEDNFNGIIRGFAKLVGGERESLGMMQYRVTNLPFDFIFQCDPNLGIIIESENIRNIDKMVRYIKDSLQDINYNMLYEERGQR